jgi:hypothetical protein
MNKNIKILLIFSVLFLIGCFPSYSVLPKEYKSVKQIQKREKAFVINKDLKSEFKILENSKIYEIVDDSTKSDLKIRLNPIKDVTSWRCGNMMSGSMITLGLLPSFDYQKYIFNYDKIKNNEIINKSDTIEIRQSLWLFNFLYPKSFKKQAGKGLLGNYLTNK